MPCPECGESTQVYADDVASLVCTSCGTLAATVQVLADTNGNASFHPAPRTSRGWHLAQTKQDRDRKNTIAMCTFISAILSRLNNPGLSPRAEAIFSQAMTRGHYRWGRRAKLTAGASIAIALREALRSDSLHDIAFLLGETPVSLSRAFRSVVSLLDFSFASTDPAVHLPILQTHLHSAIHPCPQLPKSLISVLASVSLQTAVRTATSLSQIVVHHSPPLPLANLPTPPTACALLILGLEAEARAPLPHLGELTRTLATRFALAPGVVSSRYKILYNLIEEWIRHVPWLDQFVYKDKGRGAAARSKIPKRTIVAKGIKDVIQFHQEICQSRLENQQKITLDMEPDSGEEDEEDDGLYTPMVTSSSKGANKAPPAGKQRVEKVDAMQAACRFLRDPLSSNSNVCDVSLLMHLLTCPPDQLSRAGGTAPTRLQLLAAARGGSTAEDIADEELFVEGELEGLLRDEQEREALGPLFQLNWGDEISTEEAPARRSRPTETEPKRGAKRVDMDALARILGGDVDTDEGVARSSDVDDDAYLCGPEDALHSLRDQITTGAAELVSDWRPASPDDDIFG